MELFLLQFRPAIARGFQWSGEQSRQMLQFRHHTIQFIEQRFELMSHASRAKFLHQRAVVPQCLYLRRREALEYRVTVLPHVPQDRPGVIQLVGAETKRVSAPSFLTRRKYRSFLGYHFGFVLPSSPYESVQPSTILATRGPNICSIARSIALPP